MNQYLRKRCATLLAAIMMAISTVSPVMASGNSVLNVSGKSDISFDGKELVYNELESMYTTEVKTSGLFEYTSGGYYNEIRITSYTGNESKVIIPDSIDGYKVGIIGRNAFQNCSNMQTVILPQNLRWIEREAFSGCSKLSEVEIPDSVEAIEESAFAYCSNLKSLHIPENIDSFYGNPFPYCSNLKTITTDSKGLIIKDGLIYNSNYGSENKYTLVACLAGKSGKVSLMEGLVTIWQSYDAFAGCDKITSISIPSTMLYGGAFAGRLLEDCSSLQKITVDSKNPTLKAIDGILYQYSSESSKTLDLICCPQAKTGKIKLPENVSGIKGGFRNCSKVTEITLSKNIYSYDISNFTNANNAFDPIGGPFSGCTSLKMLKVDEKNTQLRSINGSIYSKDGKTLYVVPTGTKGVYTVPDGVTAIGGKLNKWYDSRPFDNCSQITKIVIPASVKSIGECAFLGCNKLEAFSVDNKNKKYCSKSGVLYDVKETKLISCPSYIKSISIPDSVATISYNAFYDCTRLPKVDLPASVKKFEKSSVVECNFNLYFNSSQIPDFTKKEIWTLGSDKKLPTGYYYESLNAWKDAIAHNPNFAGITWKKASGIPRVSSTIALDNSVLSIAVKSTATLKATISGNAPDTTVTWSTSDKSVATVSSKGVVTAKAVGAATITAKNNGKTATCKVTVTPAAPKLKKAASSERGKIKITWEKVSGADGYVIYKKSGESWKKLASVSGASTVSYTDKGLTSGKKYTYSVAAYKKSGKTTYTSSYNKTGVSAKVK